MLERGSSPTLARSIFRRLCFQPAAIGLVSLKAQREFFNGLSSPNKRMHVFPAAYHALFHERERAQVVERIRDFIREQLASPPVRPSLLESDKYGHTWEEYERLETARQSALSLWFAVG